MPPNVGAVGPLAIFLFLTAGTIIASLIVCSYAAYSFLLTLVNTAAGCDEVDWPGDPLQDWLWMLWYLLWVGAVWSVPAVLVLGPIGLPVPLLLACAAGALWMWFPVGLLSSLSASTRWVVYRPRIMGLFFRHFGTSLCFYLLSGVLGAAMGGLLYLALRGPLPMLFLPLSGAAAGAFLLIYARLLGRMGHLISWQVQGKVRRTGEKRPAEADRVQIYDPWGSADGAERRRDTPERAREALPISQEREASGFVAPGRKKKKVAKRSVSQSVDPWAIPPQVPMAPPRPTEEMEDEVDDPLGPVSGIYRLREGDGHWEAPPQPAAPDLQEIGTYDLLPEGAANPASGHPPAQAAPPAAYSLRSVEADPPRPSLPPENPDTIRREEELARHREQPPPLARLLTRGVFSFPFYRTSLQAWVTLAVGFFAVIGLVRALIALNPMSELGY
jgi:hypothetical protein